MLILLRVPLNSHSLSGRPFEVLAEPDGHTGQLVVVTKTENYHAQRDLSADRVQSSAGGKHQSEGIEILNMNIANQPFPAEMPHQHFAGLEVVPKRSC